METIYVEWDDVAQVSSHARFEVELRSGEQFVGSLGGTGTAGELVVGSEQVILDLDRIVFIKPASPSIWDQWDGSVDLGYNFAAAGESTQLTFSTSFRRRTERLETTLSAGSFFSAQAGAEDSRRHNGSVNITRFFGRRWGVTVLS